MNAQTEHPGSERPAAGRPEFVTLTPQELSARKRRNLALAGALVAFIVLVFLVTVLNLQRNVAAREAALAVPPGPVPAAAPAAAAAMPEVTP